MLALRVPCDARMSRRDAELAIAQTDASRRPRPILCFSASLNGSLKSRPKTLNQRQTTITCIITSMFQAGIHLYQILRNL